MDVKNFTPVMLGEIISIDNGADNAFLPFQLPNEWSVPPSMATLWADAREAIGELRGIARTLHDPTILITPLRRREALKSSSLEGTYADPDELLVYEMERSAGQRGYSTDDLREVNNYQEALDYGAALLTDGYPFSEWLIRQLHKRLMDSVRGESKKPGEVRDTQVHIGVGRRFTPPPSEHLPQLLGDLEKAMQGSKSVDPLIWSLMVHYQFETIHPFRDGNGRVGRLLLALMVSRECGFDMPWLYLSEYFDEHKDEYIDALYGVSARGDWTTWIHLGLNASIETCRSTIVRIQGLLDFKETAEQKIREIDGRDRLMHVIPHLLSSPLVSYKTIERLCGVSYITARKDVQALVDVGLLKEVMGGTRPKLFMATDVYRVALAR